MDTLPLPRKPNLEQYRKRAKELVAAAKSQDPAAVRTWCREFLENIARLANIEMTPFVQDSFDRALQQLEERVREAAPNAGKQFTLANAQFLLAQAHGFANWADFAKHVEQLERLAEGSDLERAADAIVNGDLEMLQDLLRRNPELIRARSERVHKCTLLHYVAANGIEDFRQKTPPNAVAIAKCLLDAGAEVDALAETYGGGTAQTTMNLLVSSTHPYDAGLQSVLAEVLLDYGAAINGVADDCSPIMTALGFWYGDTALTLARRGARIDNILAAASVGREDLVRRFVLDAETLSPDARPVTSRWPSVPREPKRMIEIAFAWSIKFRQRAVFDVLLQKGLNVASKDLDDMTVLHWAAANGMLDVMQLLLARGAPLEVKNTWGGTVLDSTCYFAVYQPFKGVDYVATVEFLIRAGADLAPAAWAAKDPSVGPVLWRYGARSEQ